MCLGVVLGEPVLPDSKRKAQQATLWHAVHSRGGSEPESREDVAHEVGARLFPPLVAHGRVSQVPVRAHPRTVRGVSRAGLAEAKGARAVLVCR